MKISRDDALLFLLVGVPKMAAQAGVQIVGGSVQIVKIMPHLKAILDAMKIGA